MQKRHYFVIFFIIIFSLPTYPSQGNIRSVSAYLFSVPTEIVEVSINTDGSADIEYWITFKVEQGGQPIDIVDIGFPNKHYKLDSITADVDGVPVYDIRVSEVIDIGVEIHLGARTITDNGTLHVKGNQPYMIFEDNEDSTMASCEFGNTWWGAAYTVGTTNLTTRMIFPTTVTNDTYTKYHYSDEPDRIFYRDSRIGFEWNEPAASPSKQYKYGVSFPKEGIKWFTSVPLTSDEMILVLMFVGFVLVLVLIVIGKIRSRRKKQRRLEDYVPPFVEVPTAGPRMDLSREEVAIILEKPAQVTASMIILSLIQKGFLQQITEESAPPTASQEKSKKRLRKYERLVLKSISEEGSMDEEVLAKAIASLVRYVKRKMRGYSYDKTVDYYEDIIRRAVDRIKSESFDRVPKEDWYWAVLDDEFLPEFENLIKKKEDYPYQEGYIPWYYYHSYHRWYWVPRSRGFARKITKISNPVPRSRGSRSRGGSKGRGGCACACACAGCACACAGGGR
ncbi:MAG: hypothetical protein ACTSPV_04420 [Candidatus Hodarchaeales archaeon]